MRALSVGQLSCGQSGVELAVYIKRAMESAGVTNLAQLPTADIHAALREYEILRSHRVSFIIKKSLASGAIVPKRSWLVRCSCTCCSNPFGDGCALPSWIRHACICI